MARAASASRLPISAASAFGLLLLLGSVAVAQEVSGLARAYDLLTTIDVSGISSAQPIDPFNLSAGPVTSVTGVAPAPFFISTTTGGVPVESTGHLAPFRVSTDIRSLQASSDLSDGAGSGVATAVSGIAQAEATISFISLAVELLSIVISADDPEDSPITSTSTVAWDGTSTTASGSTNLLTAGSVSVFVAGELQVLPPLTSGVSTNISFTEAYPEAGPGSISGQITLTPDYVMIPNPDGRLVTTTSLLVDASIKVYRPAFGGFPSPLWDIDINTRIAFNISQASMRLTAVPEPAGTVLLLAGASLAGLHRRRA